MSLHKLLLPALVNAVLTSTTFSQTTSQPDCLAIESENEQLTSSLNEKEQSIADLNSKLNKLENDVQYLKESLDLANSKTTFESDDLVYKVTSVVGKSDQNRIVVEGLVENHGAVRKLQMDGDVYVVDPKGNRIKHDYRGTNLGGESYIPKLQRNIPIKMRIEFGNVIEQPPTIKALILSFYNLDDAIFKDLDVNWE